MLLLREGLAWLGVSVNNTSLSPYQLTVGKGGLRFSGPSATFIPRALGRGGGEGDIACVRHCAGHNGSEE